MNIPTIEIDNLDVILSREKTLSKLRNKKWYSERGSIQAKIKSILKSKKYDVDMNDCYFALDSQYKPTEELKVILNKLHQYILLKELY
jgi:hypothetical protein